ncbi:TIGR04255 family protein [Paraburkholderia sp. B3]|uniref:TIGR04255 family protein n=1 Tax=Paraburkholderia sp. B3 TaxID=3134791 RepID=UPI0039829B06
MTKPSFQPVGGAHAIEMMAIGIEWATPLTETQLGDLQKVYDSAPEIRDFLPSHAPLQGFSIQHVAQFDAAKQQPQIISPPQFVTQISGFDMSQLDSAGKVSWVTSVRPPVLSCTCSVYDRWKNVKPKSLSILQPFIDVVLSAGVKIRAIGLQYQDAFRLPDGISQEVSKELFRQDGLWLPRHVFNEPSYWHCHQGWFSKGPTERRILNNVTTDISDVNGACFARLGGQHRVFSTSFDAKDPIDIQGSDIDEMLDFLHEQNKQVINGILSDVALESIGCSVGDA